MEDAPRLAAVHCEPKWLVTMFYDAFEPAGAMPRTTRTIGS